MLRFRMLLAFMALASLGSAQLTEAERQGVADALYVGNLRISDLGFERKPFSDPYRMPLVDFALDQPLDAADSLMALHAATREMSPAMLLAKIIEGIYEEPLEAMQHDPPITGLSELPADLRAPILGLVNWINSTNNEIKHATERAITDYIKVNFDL